MKLLNRLKLAFGTYFPKTAKKGAFNKYENLKYGDRLPGGWHEYELLLLPELLDRNSVFLDVGSNLGIYVHKALQSCNANNIYAFEPLREYNKFLSSVFPDVNLTNIALSNQTGTSPIRVPIFNRVGNYSRASLSAYTDCEMNSFRQLYEVETVTLDSYVLKHKIDQIDLIKIDVEGHETEVFEGAKATLAEHRPIIIAEIESRYVDDPDTLVEFLKNIGYECLYIKNETLELVVLDGPVGSVQVEHQLGTDQYVNNFVFIDGKNVNAIVEKIQKLI